LDLLVWGLFLGVLVGAAFAGLGVELWSSGMVVEGGGWGRNKGADGCGLSSRISCSFPTLESALWLGTAAMGGVKSRCLARCYVKLGCRQDLGKTNSSGQDLDVISKFLKDLSARKDCKDCTVPFLKYKLQFFSQKKCLWLFLNEESFFSKKKKRVCGSRSLVLASPNKK